jgi:hypothetical protein
MMANSIKSRAARAACMSTAGALLLALAWSFAGGVRSLAQTPQAQSAAPAPPPDHPKTYIPDLGDFMRTIQIHHEKLWLSARAKNWPLVGYQLSEMKETFSDVADLVPNYKSVPVGQMIEAITVGPIANLEKAVEDKDSKTFAAAFDELTAACNKCHTAASRGFIRIRRPSSSTFSNQDFNPRRR